MNNLGVDKDFTISAKVHLTPHMSQLLFYIILQLEKRYPP